MPRRAPHDFSHVLGPHVIERDGGRFSSGGHLGRAGGREGLDLPGLRMEKVGAAMSGGTKPSKRSPVPGSSADSLGRSAWISAAT